MRASDPATAVSCLRASGLQETSWPAHPGYVRSLPLKRFITKLARCCVTNQNETGRGSEKVSRGEGPGAVRGKQAKG